MVNNISREDLKSFNKEDMDSLYLSLNSFVMGQAKVLGRLSVEKAKLKIQLRKAKDMLKDRLEFEEFQGITRYSSQDIEEFLSAED